MKYYLISLHISVFLIITSDIKAKLKQDGSTYGGCLQVNSTFGFANNKNSLVKFLVALRDVTHLYSRNSVV